jgi:small subunit ribosomal protein S27e
MPFFELIPPRIRQLDSISNSDTFGNLNFILRSSSSSFWSAHRSISSKKATSTHINHGAQNVALHLLHSDDINKPLAVDLLNPSLEHEKRQHKLKRLVQSPNSYFMDVKCPGWSASCPERFTRSHTYRPAGCFAITTVFSHAQSVVLCGSCASVLCQPTGGKARLTEGMHSQSSCSHTAEAACTRLLFPSEELDISATLVVDFDPWNQRFESALGGGGDLRFLVHATATGMSLIAMIVRWCGGIWLKQNNSCRPPVGHFKRSLAPLVTTRRQM